MSDVKEGAMQARAMKAVHPIKRLPFAVAAAPLAAAAAMAPFAYGQGAGAETTIEEVTVTGSRIVRKDYSSSSPVVTTDVEEIREFGAVTVEQQLNVMPQFQEGNTSTTNALGGGKGATLNLRALGPTRSLVLLDGRRLPVSGSLGDVDVNIIPPIMLKGVEVLTGGASAAYGSEAIAGVVNFQSPEYFEGVEFSYEGGDSEEGGAGKTDLGLLIGFDGSRSRGTLALGYTDRKEVDGRDRDFWRPCCLSSFIGQGVFRNDPSNPISADAVRTLFQGDGYNEAINVRNIVSSNDDTPEKVTAAMNRAAVDRLGFNDDGTLFDQWDGAENYKGPRDATLYDGADSVWVILNDNQVRMNVARQDTNQIKPMERYSLFAKGEFDLMDEVRLYGQVLYSDAETESRVSRNLTLFGPTITVPVAFTDAMTAAMNTRDDDGDLMGVDRDNTNPYIPDDLLHLLATRSNPDQDFVITKRFMDVPSRRFDERFTTSQVLVGIEGDVGIKDWTFDVFASRDNVAGNERIPFEVLGNEVNNLLHSTGANGEYDGGASICKGGYNPFGLQNSLKISPECLAYISPGELMSLDSERTTLEGFVTGTLFGEVQFSLSAASRKDSFDFLPSANIQNDNALGILVMAPTSGATETTEFGLEFLVPVLSSLDMTAGYRYSDQDVSGSGDSWNFGLEWRPADSIFLRGSYQVAIRSPNIGELFSGRTGAEINVGLVERNPDLGDPCDHRNSARAGDNNAPVSAICLAQAEGATAATFTQFTHGTDSMAGSSGGNENLAQEEAETFTLGVVWQPDFGGNDFAVTLDYWQIEVEDVITAIDGDQVLDRCYLPRFNPTFDPENEFCRSIIRGSDGLVTDVRSDFLNLSVLETSGWDLQANFSMGFGPGTLSLGAALGYLLEYSEQLTAEDRAYDFAGTIGGPADRVQDNDVHPEWKAIWSATYEWGAGTISARWRWLDEMDAKSTVTNPDDDTPASDSVNYIDLYGTYTFAEKWTVRLGINNLFEEDPVVVDGSPGKSRGGTYDQIGRYYSFGVKAAF